ncbi:hypothetical protein BMF94_6327 [Rhodotorula taiwanensis]|uniref:Uncharacterized protein n=1 Tax=Rhodotorula taiwanensis TaxID=741276 RepID=A0A2S5B1P4_9BASI|nr:hypothetical protein BMF94_6327 [Rhodotorula taiwanensis]
MYPSATARFRTGRLFWRQISRQTRPARLPPRPRLLHQRVRYRQDSRHRRYLDSRWMLRFSRARGSCRPRQRARPCRSRCSAGSRSGGSMRPQRRSRAGPCRAVHLPATRRPLHLHPTPLRSSPRRVRSMRSLQRSCLPSSANACRTRFRRGAAGRGSISGRRSSRRRTRLCGGESRSWNGCWSRSAP